MNTNDREVLRKKYIKGIVVGCTTLFIIIVFVAVSVFFNKDNKVDYILGKDITNGMTQKNTTISVDTQTISETTVTRITSDTTVKKTTEKASTKKKPKQSEKKTTKVEKTKKKETTTRETSIVYVYLDPTTKEAEPEPTVSTRQSVKATEQKTTQPGKGSIPYQSENDVLPSGTISAIRNSIKAELGLAYSADLQNAAIAVAKGSYSNGISALTSMGGAGWSNISWGQSSASASCLVSDSKDAIVRRMTDVTMSYVSASGYSNVGIGINSSKAGDKYQIRVVIIYSK